MRDLGSFKVEWIDWILFDRREFMNDLKEEYCDRYCISVKKVEL
jgi:hypothetical protein